MRRTALSFAAGIALATTACTNPPPRPRLVAAPPLPASGVIVDLSPTWPRPYAEGQAIELAGSRVEVDPRSNVAAIAPNALFGKVVVLEIAADAGSRLTAGLDVADIERFENAHGEIGAEDRVLLRTDYAAQAGGWVDRASTFVDPPSAPGFTLEAIRLLVERRGVRTIGSDSPRLTHRRETEADGKRLLHERSGILLLNLSGLDRLPPRGATIVVAPLPRADLHSAPVRVFALVPR